MPDAEIGVFGGSGFSELLPGAAEVVVETPYGPPSAPITVGEVGGRRGGFLPRPGGRRETFYDGPETVHISMAEPYCPTLRDVVLRAAREMELPLHERGTVVVIQGPRFSTRAESLWFRSQGWEVVNMTQYPECALAREREICYANISLITDYDVGVEGDSTITPVTAAEVVRIFRENLNRLRDLIFRVIPAIPRERTCICATALQQARV